MNNTNQTTIYHADLTGLRLSIYIKIPQPISDANAARKAEIKALLEPYSEYVAQLHKPVDTPEIQAIIDATDFGAIRSEFRRKAKKLGVPLSDGDFNVSIFSTDTMIELVAEVRRK